MMTDPDLNQSSNGSNYSLYKSVTAHKKAIAAVKFSPDGVWLASCSMDKRIKIWNVHDGRCEITLKGHKKGVLDIAWSAGGSFLISASEDKTLKVWNVQDGKRVARVWTLRGHQDSVLCCNFNNDSRRIASGSFDKKIRIWNFHSGQCLKTLDGHSKAVIAVHFSLGGTRIVSGSVDGQCLIWDVQTWACEQKICFENSPGISCVMFLPNFQILLIGTMNDTLSIVDRIENKIVKTYISHQNSRYCVNSAFMFNERQSVVSGSEDHCIYIWDLNSEEIFQKLEGHTDVVVSIACHPSQQMIASAALDNDNTIKFWKVFS